MVQHLAHLERVRINFAWILKLRWLAAAGQLFTILLVRLCFGIELPIQALVAVLALEVVTNLMLGGWSTRQARSAEPEPVVSRRLEAALGSVLLVDIALLAILLFLTGGPTNPFAVFYIVNIVLAAVVVPPLWAAAVVFLALATFTALFFVHVPLPELERLGYFSASGGSDPHWFGDRLSLYLKGLLVAFGMAAATVAVFVTRLNIERNALEESLEEIRLRKARSDRLEALGTLAAGAAHELASPLSTIAVIAKDLEIALARALPDDEAAEDARLIRQEVSRCRQIIDQMAADAGQSAADNLVVGTVDELLDAVLQDLRRRDHVVIDVAHDSRERALRLPRRALSLALRQIVKNALDASHERGPVNLSVRESEEELLVVVTDRGEGMTPETLERATDPFFTTKEPGQGMGLGLFLSQSVIDRLDGRITFESSPGRGTTVTVGLPLAQVATMPTTSQGPSEGSK